MVAARIPPRLIPLLFPVKMGRLMSHATQFRSGDRVVHANKPEWGVGVVLGAQPMRHEQQPAQRVRVRFERAGLKTLSSPPAEIRPADQSPAVEQPFSEEGGGWLDELSRPSNEEVMTRLPEPATDPFRPLSGRLAATLDLYRFEPSGGSLIDWAATQTGLADPLSRFNRHELEEHFQRFAEQRDAHLRRLVDQARRSEPETLASVAKTCPPQGREALRRIDARR